MKKRISQNQRAPAFTLIEFLIVIANTSFTTIPDFVADCEQTGRVLDQSLKQEFA